MAAEAAAAAAAEEKESALSSVSSDVRQEDAEKDIRNTTRKKKSEVRNRWDMIVEERKVEERNQLETQREERIRKKVDDMWQSLE